MEIVSRPVKLLTQVDLKWFERVPAAVKTTIGQHFAIVKIYEKV